jgi:hypothetical protein
MCVRVAGIQYLTQGDPNYKPHSPLSVSRMKAEETTLRMIVTADKVKAVFRLR